MIAMNAFFLSLAIVMDGEFLKLPKFKDMVNGGGSGYELNGWHGMYVFTKDNSIQNDRIKPIDIDMGNLISDCINGAQYWSTQRQWLNHEWRPSER